MKGPCRSTSNWPPFFALRSNPGNCAPGGPVTVPAAQSLREHTVYECPDCEQRLLGEQRCPDCATFARRVGPGSACPHCGEPVAIADLTQEVATMPAGR